MVSAAIGGGTYLLTTLSKQEPIWALTMSIFIGGVSLVVQFLIDLEGRIAVMDQRQREQFSKISKATELFGRVEAAELRTDTVVDLVQYATTIEAGDKPLLAGLVRAEMQSMAEFLRQISYTMTADYPGDERLLLLVDNARHSMKATSTIGASGLGLVDESYWNSPMALAYLEHQRQAIRLRKLEIRRIFIAYQRDLPHDADFQRIVRGQLDAGIAVRILPNPPMNHHGMLDFVLFDDEMSLEFLTGPVFGSQLTSAVQSTQLIMRDYFIQRRRSQFDEWWERAIDATEFLED
jgi:hypothetical protein